MNKKFLLLALVLASLSVYSENFTSGVVNANKLNVRAQALKNATIVCQLEKGQRVLIQEVKDDWLKITIPSNASTWIFSQFIDANNSLTADSIYVRSGPGVAYHPIGKLPLKTKVEVLKTQRTWSKIKPLPKFLFAWVSAKYIDYINTEEEETPPIAITEKQGKTEENKIPLQKRTKNDSKDKIIEDIKQQHKPNKKEASTIVTDNELEQTSEVIIKPVSIEEVSLEQADENITKRQQERKDFIALTGYVLKIDASNNYVHYALAEKHEERYFPICYLSGFKEELEDFVNKKIKVVGIQRFVKGWYRPIIYVNSFEAIEEE